MASGVMFDTVILDCKQCGRRRVYDDLELEGAEALKTWLDNSPGRCLCGAGRCEVNAHLKEVPEIPPSELPN